MGPEQCVSLLGRGAAQRCLGLGTEVFQSVGRNKRKAHRAKVTQREGRLERSSRTEKTSGRVRTRPQGCQSGTGGRASVSADELQPESFAFPLIEFLLVAVRC